MPSRHAMVNDVHSRLNATCVAVVVKPHDTDQLRETGAEDIYGTIRAIRKDDTTFLPWARQDYGCVIFNLRTRHTPAAVAHTSPTRGRPGGTRWTGPIRSSRPSSG